ncbi:MAG: glycoside hydrolase family 38 C-terminal domain-containing protein [Phycisphaerae bacterium]
MNKKTIHLLCNAHLDPVWLWEWEEGAAAAISTFRTAADLCEEFEGFVFNHNEAVLYQWVEEYEPSLFERIRRLVREGKWHIMGGWYLQPDCNMPSGESFVRHILTGKRYFKEKFGVDVTTAINLDSFGHSWGLPQILVKSGYDSYLFCRPFQNDCPLPDSHFVWVGCDGSEVMACRVDGWYTSQLGKAHLKIMERMKNHPDKPFSLLLWGVGDHGGGPSREDLEEITGLIRNTKDFNIVHSNTTAFFAEMKKQYRLLPRYKRDLNPWGVGCYTSQVRIKQKHRQLENQLYLVEKMATAAASQDLMEYPREELRRAMRDLLIGEFHDILPGSSIEPVEDASLRLFDHALEELSRVKARAFFALASGQPRAKGEQIPILVYNPHPFKVRTIVECEFQLADANWAGTWTLLGVRRGGRAIPSQIEKEASNLNLDWRKKVAFMAELDPSQMNRFDCRIEKVVQTKPVPKLKVRGGRVAFRSDDIEVVINAKTGLVDCFKVHGIDYLEKDAFEPLVMADNEDPWGMLNRAYRKVAGRFKLMSAKKSAQFSGVRCDELPPVRVIEDGPVRSVVEVMLSYNDSFICQRYKLPKQGTEIEIELRVHWNEKDRMLKLSIPVRLAGFEFLGQTAFGVNPLPMHGNEAVAQKWVAVVSRRAQTAITCINEGSYGSDFSTDGLRLTLLRSPAYAGHPFFDRPIVEQDRYTPRIDQGERVFRFWLNAGSLGERLSVIDREALVHNEKPYALSFFPSGAGARPKAGAVLSDDVVQMSCLKLAEDNDDLIVRLFEPTGQARSTTLSLPCIGFKTKVDLGPLEVKTLRVNPKSRAVRETDLIERPIGR